MSRLVSVLLPLFLLLGDGPQAIAEVTELVTIPLSHRLAADLLPVVQPLLAPDETVVSSGELLIVRARPEKIRELRDLIGQLDTRQHRLMITVIQGHESGLAGIEAELRLGGRMELGAADGSGVIARGSLREGKRRDAGSSVQRIQTLDGQPAFVEFGEERPVVRQAWSADGRQMIITDPYRELTTGFSVTPRLSDRQVFIDLAPWLDRIGAAGRGVIETQTAETRLTAPLGQWVEIGGQFATASSAGGELLGMEERHARRSERIFLRVDDLDSAHSAP